MELTPRQRWLALLAGKTPDRIPTDFQGTPEVIARLLADLNCPDEPTLWRRLHVDKRLHLVPEWTPRRPPQPGRDMWGIGFSRMSYGSGTYDEATFHPLAAAQTPADVHALAWPDPDDFDYTTITAAVRADDGRYPIHAGCYEPFLLYGQLRGLQTSFEDLALRPELAEVILGHIFDFHFEHHRRIFVAGRGRIDTSWVAEDLGAQTGPLMSLAMYRRFLLSNQVRMAELARSHAIHVMYHTDGAARLFIPDLIDKVGIEILNPIQWRCAGMERERLVADFGPRVIFHGSIDNQQTLPFGTPDDVAAEVRESIEIYRPARWICAPCHAIQPVTPTANIVAMYETIHELGCRGPLSG